MWDEGWRQETVWAGRRDSAADSGDTASGPPVSSCTFQLHYLLPAVLPTRVSTVLTAHICLSIYLIYSVCTAKCTHFNYFMQIQSTFNADTVNGVIFVQINIANDQNGFSDNIEKIQAKQNWERRKTKPYCKICMNNNDYNNNHW